MKPILVFDLGGVLMKHDFQGCKDAFKRILGSNFDSTWAGATEESRKLLEDFETGKIHEREFLSKLMSRCQQGTTESDTLAAWNSLHAGIPEEMFTTLRDLRRQGFRLYLLSNNNEIHWKDVVAHYSLEAYMDDIFLSFKEHLAKPDTAFYRLVETRIQAKGHEIFFVDDMPVNRKAAESLGWKCFADVPALLEELQASGFSSPSK